MSNAELKEIAEKINRNQKKQLFIFGIKNKTLILQTESKLPI
ncbi:MAG: hypothetical protein WCR45_01950 [Bacteroidaceae bacterium]